MAKFRIRLMAHHIAYAGICAFNVLNVSAATTKTRIEWISVYDGNEARFSSADRKRLLSALKGLGVDHVVKQEDQEILVNANNQSLIQDLLSKVMVQQGVRSR
jgi:hypothetical protein